MQLAMDYVIAPFSSQLQQHSDALSWYNLCGQFSSSSDFHDNNMAKLYRNKASCYISLNQLDRVSHCCIFSLFHTGSFILSRYFYAASSVHYYSEALPTTALCRS